MKKIIILFLFLVGCSKMVVTPKQLEASSIIKTFYIISDDTFDEIEKVINKYEPLKILSDTRFDKKPLIEEYRNTLNITLTNRDLPNIIIYQDEKGEFNSKIYNVYLSKDKQAYVQDGFEEGDSLSGSVYLSFTNSDVSYSVDFYKDEIVYSYPDLTDDTKNIALNYYKEFKENEIVDTGFIDEIIEIIKSGKKYDVVESDTDIIKNLNYYDSVEPIYEYFDNSFFVSKPYKNLFLAKRNEYSAVISKEGELISKYDFLYPYIYNGEIVLENHDDEFINDGSLALKVVKEQNKIKYRNLVKANDKFMTHEYSDFGKNKLCDVSVKFDDYNKIYPYQIIEYDKFTDDGNGCIIIDEIFNKNMGLINYKGETLELDSYYWSNSFGDVVIVGGDTSQLYNSELKLIEFNIPFEKIVTSSNGKIVVKAEYLGYGILNEKGETIVPFIYDYITIINDKVYCKVKNLWSEIVFE